MLEYKNILVPVDFSDISSVAIKKAISARAASPGNLILMHIIDYLPPPYAAAEVPAIFASDDLMTERAEKHLADLASELNAGDCERVVKTGKAKKLLVQFIQDNDVDLVVMAAHNNGAIEKLLGSTTNSVVQHVPCDVLVIHG